MSKIEATKERFRTAYGDRIRGIIPEGTRTENIYEYRVDSYGRKVLEKSGERNIWEEIQASLEETKIENILARAAAGDGSVFRADGIYLDCTAMPTNLIEARQQIQNLENLWAKIPNEIKNKYNNSVEDFISASGSKQWLDDMGLGGVKLEKDEMPTPDKAGILGEKQGAVKEETINES